jgi:uncharacterized protein (TIGR00255 family)
VLLSMTGYGEARGQDEAQHIQVEIRAVNNRFFKLVVRAPELLSSYELELERLIRKTIRRGTLTLLIRMDRGEEWTDTKLDLAILQQYVEQIRGFGMRLGLPSEAVTAMIGQAVHLPGVAPENRIDLMRSKNDWALIEPLVAQAVERLQQMRQDEGRRMAQELLALCGRIAWDLQHIRKRSPQVVADYRQKLQERIREVLSQQGVGGEAPEILKEVAVFADRCDITEELVRLESHLDQFRDVVEGENESPGRKLEFLVQEMGRETNTIGSKASDAQIARHVVEIKANLERMREIIQNVE